MFSPGECFMCTQQKVYSLLLGGMFCRWLLGTVVLAWFEVFHFLSDLLTKSIHYQKLQYWNLQLLLWLSTSFFSSIIFCFMYFSALVLDTYMLQWLSSWWILFIIKKMSFFVHHTIFVLHCVSSDMNTATPIFFLFLFAWCISPISLLSSCLLLWI